MTRAHVVVAAFLPVVSAAVFAGSSWPRDTTDVVQRQEVASLRGSRRRTTSEPSLPPPPAMCNSIGCPDGYIPIPDHDTTECPGGDCTVEACCEAMCACYGCPDNYTPIESEAQELCHGGVCTTEQCCETAHPTCSSIGCPDGYIPIPDHDTTECPGGDCTVEACCEAMCACYGCPDNYTPIESEAQELCHGGVCTTEQCCETGARDEPASETCSSFRCPHETHRPIEGAGEKRCKTADFMAPTPPPRNGGGGGGSYDFDYGFSSDEWDDYVVGYSYGYGMEGGEEGGMASDGGSYWDGAEEYCDLRTCCEEKEYGLWGLE
ncbi:unnamed protein product [Ectocarpus fasciculatus]